MDVPNARGSIDYRLSLAIIAESKISPNAFLKYSRAVARYWTGDSRIGSRSSANKRNRHPINRDLQGRGEGRFDLFGQGGVRLPKLSEMDQGNFITVAREDEVREGSMFGVAIAGNPILLSRIGGKIYAMDAVCSHYYGYLPRGELRDPARGVPALRSHP